MKINKWRLFLLLGLSLVLLLLLFPISAPIMAAAPAVTVSISPNPSNRVTGGDFWVNVNVTQVTDLNTYHLDVTYDPAIIQVMGTGGGPGVTGGQIVGQSIPITWGFNPSNVQGKISVAGNLNAQPGQGANGTGYLCRIHFVVVGSAGQTGTITPTNIGMFGTLGGPLTIQQAIPGSVNILYPPVTVSVSAPANVPAGGDFVARINTSLVANLSAYEFDITYNPAAIQVIGAEGGPGVTSGLIGSTVIPVDMWSYYPYLLHTPGTITVFGHIPFLGIVTGSGYVAEIHFHVLASSGQASINFTEHTPGWNMLIDNVANTITPVTWVGTTVNIVTSSNDTLSNLVMSTGTLSPVFASGTTSYAAGVSNSVSSITVTPTVNESHATVTVNGTAVASGTASGAIGLTVGANAISIVVTGQDTFTMTYTVTVTRAILLGDANGDGVVNMGDVTKVMRIILGLDPLTLGADANGDSIVNMGDATKIEMIILGVDS